MADAPRKVPLVFYRTAAGEDVVRNSLRQLEDADRNAIGQDLMRVQFRWPIGMPLCRSLGDRLWEVRSRLRRGRTARVVFCFADGHLHRAAWLREDDADNPDVRAGARPQATARVHPGVRR